MLVPTKLPECAMVVNKVWLDSPFVVFFTDPIHIFFNHCQLLWNFLVQWSFLVICTKTLTLWIHCEKGKHISVFIYQHGIAFFRLILWSCVLGIWVKVPLTFQGKTLEHGNLQLWRKILIFQEQSIMVCPTNKGNIQCSSVGEFYSSFTNML